MSSTRRYSARGTAPAVPLTVGTLRSLAPTVASELVGSFLTARPNTAIVHTEGSTTELIDGHDGRVDVAITAPKPPSGSAGFR
jgi:DNA-binding transcriptional LysR family regulator